MQYGADETRKLIFFSGGLFSSVLAKIYHGAFQIFWRTLHMSVQASTRSPDVIETFRVKP